MLTIQDTKREETVANRVLDILDRWAEGMNGQQAQKRKWPRRKLRSRMTAYLPEMAGDHAEECSLDVWSRDLSKSGASFVYRGEINARTIVLCLDADGAGAQWLQAVIVRKRQVHNGFQEYGVQFTSSAGK